MATVQTRGDVAVEVERFADLVFAHNGEDEVRGEVTQYLDNAEYGLAFDILADHAASIDLHKDKRVRRHAQRLIREMRLTETTSSKHYQEVYSKFLD